MANLFKKLNDKTKFSATEQVIVDYVLENFREVANLSTRELAKRTFTSSAAIVRFSQKLGFEGYSDFKIKFLSEVVQYLNEPHDKFITDKDSLEMIIEKVVGIEIDALKDTHDNINSRQFLRALNYLSSAEHVDFYAMHANVNLAKIAAESFIMANKFSTVHSSMTMQYLQAYHVPPSHISIIISRTGENRMLLDIAKTLHKQKSPIFCITSQPKSTLANLAQVVFAVASSDTMEELGPRVFLTGAKYVIDVLFALMMSKIDYQEAKKKEEWLSKNFRY